MHQSNITNNGTHAFYASACTDTETVINAENNWWGTTDPAEIESMIWHHTDYSSAPTVDFTPCADEPFIFDITTGVFDRPGHSVPTGFTLLQNYPNPFNAATAIAFDLRDRSFVRIEVFDLLGRRVARLASDAYEPGRHVVVFDGTTDGHRPLSSGVYFYRLTAGQHTETRKMLLLK